MTLLLHDRPAAQATNPLQNPALAPLFAGGVLMVLGLGHRGFLGLLTAAAGGMLAYRQIHRLWPPDDPRTAFAANSPPERDDVVDEASWESFPASDPPGY